MIIFGQPELASPQRKILELAGGPRWPEVGPGRDWALAAWRGDGKVPHALLGGSLATLTGGGGYRSGSPPRAPSVVLGGRGGLSVVPSGAYGNPRWYAHLSSPAFNVKSGNQAM